MLGTAANSSMTKDNKVFNLVPAISERKMAIAKLIGTPISIAMPELTKVPII